MITPLTVAFMGSFCFLSETRPLLVFFLFWFVLSFLRQKKWERREDGGSNLHQAFLQASPHGRAACRGQEQGGLGLKGAKEA